MFLNLASPLRKRFSTYVNRIWDKHISFLDICQVVLINEPRYGSK